MFCTLGSFRLVSVSVEAQRTRNEREPKRLKIISIWGDASFSVKTAIHTHTLHYNAADKLPMPFCVLISLFTWPEHFFWQYVSGAVVFCECIRQWNEHEKALKRIFNCLLVQNLSHVKSFCASLLIFLPPPLVSPHSVQQTLQDSVTQRMMNILLQDLLMPYNDVFIMNA